MKRNFLLLCTSLLSGIISYSQLTIQSGATVTLEAGAVLAVQGPVNSHADIQGAGKLLLNGTALQDLNMNGFSLAHLEISNTSNVNLTGAVNVNTLLTLTNGRIILNAHNLSIGSAGSIAGASNTKYVITNGTGRLVKNALGNTGFTFPVGFDAGTYNPLNIVQNGTVDVVGVRVLENVKQNGSGGSAFVKEVVNASWEVEEGVSGGSNLNLTAQWSGTDEMPGFNRNKTGISMHDGTGWNLTNVLTGAAAGSGPYTVARSGITDFAGARVFAVGTRPVLINLLVAARIYLQGAYLNTSTPGLMRAQLTSVLPTTDPYPSIGFSHLGSGGGEQVFSATLATSGSATDVVDWVFAQLHRASDGAVIATRSVLVQRDGLVIDEDPTSNSGSRLPYISFSGVPDDAANFYVSLRHRNHLSVRTSSLLNLERTSATSHNFTSSLSNAFAGSSPNNDPMATLGVNAFGLWGGNANSDNRSTKIGLPQSNDYSLLLNFLGNNPSVSGVYRREDFNLDGVVRKTGLPHQNDYSILLNILGTRPTINQPSF